MQSCTLSRLLKDRHTLDDELVFMGNFPMYSIHTNSYKKLVIKTKGSEGEIFKAGFQGTQEPRNLSVRKQKICIFFDNLYTLFLLIRKSFIRKYY